jgi:thiol-disulfide isomerase/thioredoxin
VSTRWIFAGVALLAILAGIALWLANETAPLSGSAEVSPAALYAASFRDPSGQPQSLGRYQGRIVVLNFWATWCAPCREEMPAFQRLQGRYADRNVQFVGLANDDPAKVARFARELGIGYPLWTGGPEVDELSRRLGDGQGALPFTVIVDSAGNVVEQRVGAYSEADLAQELARLVQSATAK